jgi:hypothetical protein
MLGLALQGATLVACAQVEEGMSCLDEATATALAGEWERGTTRQEGYLNAYPVLALLVFLGVSDLRPTRRVRRLAA